MLRELIAWVLNNYLGKYVGNLNTAQLSVALMSGEVELENLPLRRDALRNLGLPLQALSGTVGKIKLQIPVRQFRSAPWCIYIENVYVIIGPVNLEEWDAVTEQQAELEYKLSRLDCLEAKWRGQREVESEGNYYASSYSGWVNYGTTLVTNIVENLELKIKNVHLRYEDSITASDSRFACGLTIDSLSARSCDSNWMFGFLSAWNSNSVSFKLVELEAMSMYWDSNLQNDEMFGDILPMELADAMKNCKTLHKYIVNPVSAEAKLKRDRSETPLRTRSRPRLVCDLVLNEVRLELADTQYNQMVSCVRGLDDIAKYRRFKLLRPQRSVMADPKSWWLYAAQCHGYKGISHQRRHEIAKDNFKYIEIFTKIVINPNEILSNHQQEHKDRVEKERTYDELKILREICMLRMPTANSTMEGSNQGRSMLVQWFPQWWGWYSNKTPTNTNEPPLISTSSVDQEQMLHKDQNYLEDEILNALAAGSVENNSLLKRDAVFGKFDFTLKKGTLDICTSASNVDNSVKVMLQLQFENLLLCIESRPRSGSHFVELSLGTVSLKDHITEHTEFPDLIKPQTKDDSITHHSRMFSQRFQRTNVNVTSTEPLFQLIYERKPLSYNTDYRLLVKSQSLDVVYNSEPIKWIVDFLMKPHQVLNTRKKIEAMKNKTKNELMKNWENILEGNVSDRKTWMFEIDISAPQIIFAENVRAKNGTIVVIDFGRLQLSNSTNVISEKKAKDNSMEIRNSEMDDDEAFMTPCSTPPGSSVSTTDNSPTLCTALSDCTDVPYSNNGDAVLSEKLLHEKLYDCFNIDLTDLQVLVCKNRERWSFASSKGSSSLHVLDRFSISLQLERRVVYTNDPQFPNLTLSGSLPKIVAHINEQKIEAITKLLNTFTNNNSHSPIKSPTMEDFENITKKPIMSPMMIADEELPTKEVSKLIILHFVIDQMSLELQSQGRSIVELQVSGVKIGFSKRPEDTNFTLSVHGLLLVDAIQSFGPDFELLIASHRHVGIDSVSGSLKQSEPCSPNSGVILDQAQDRRPTSPHTISKALSNLQRTNSATWNAADDADALITVEILFVTPDGGCGEHLQIANIQFNNLDIIANQETIVELIGFAKRVIPKKKNQIITKQLQVNTLPTSTEIPCAEKSTMRTEITFDFNRLNVLVLRAITRDDFLIGRKVGTFTMSETRIHATLGDTVTVEGSLGGLQILDLTPEGVAHQRILSVGKDPLTDPPHIQRDLLSSLTQELYTMGNNRDKYSEDCQALSFKITKNVSANISIKIRMASVWYTHCARFMQEISWCASEFKHYLKNLAKSIRDKATDMALGLVQSRLDMATKGFISQQFQSPRRNDNERDKNMVDISLDVILDTPVVVLPRSSCSAQVLVAHLGQITVSNKQHDPINTNYDIGNNLLFNDFIDPTANEAMKSEWLDCSNEKTYVIDVRNMNMFSLDTSTRKAFKFSLPRAEEFYSCSEDAIPVLYDTAIHLEITNLVEYHQELMGDIVGESTNILQVSGSVVKPLNLSLSKNQFEQLIDSMENIFKVPDDLVRPPTDIKKKKIVIHEDVVDSSMTNQLEFNAQFNRRKYSQPNISHDKRNPFESKVLFELPVFVIQLKQANDPLVEIFFRDFNISYEKNNIYETNIQVSLRSVLMEDLLQPHDSKHRSMVISSSPEVQTFRTSSSFSSRSCPNLVELHNLDDHVSGSLPESLEISSGFRIAQTTNSSFSKPSCPETPPPSPQQRQRQDNLVLYSLLMVDSECPTFATQYNSIHQSSSIDFNCLNLIISVQSWIVFLNFFGLLSDETELSTINSQEIETTPIDLDRRNDKNTELEISIRSLTLVFIRTDYEIAKANVSNARFVVSRMYQSKMIEGKLGSISLNDLTTHGTIYRERFLTDGNEALNFIYSSNGQKMNVRSLNSDANLLIRMSSVRYVHTKRFVAEIQAFFKEFQQLQTPVLKRIKPSDSRNHLQQRPIQLELDIKAGSPIILLPLSSRSDKMIVADLGEFSLRNSFHYASETGVISIKTDLNGPDEILEVMLVDLVNTDLFAGQRRCKNESKNGADVTDFCMDMGTYLILKKGANLLNDKCHLELIVERNMDSCNSQNTPDFSVQGTLSRLEAILNLQQYKLIRGFLSYNLGEPIDDLFVEEIESFANSRNSMLSATIPKSHVWTNISITLDLQDVSVRLQIPEHDFNFDYQHIMADRNVISLACINFIKSSLKIDTFSDGTQDIDLVSKEILVTDTRFLQHTSPKNIFFNILQPINFTSGTDAVQAEVHCRKRKDVSKYTILLNNMRLIAILDWLEIVQDFLAQNSDEPVKLNVQVNAATIIESHESGSPLPTEPFEVILNITDTELVFVETPDQPDSNAVILKSTTVVSYRPMAIDKIISINLNHLEVFSCVMGFEEETALSIIDPITINMDVKRNILDIQLQKRLYVRLSYNDLKMFAQMMESVPQQTRKAKHNCEIKRNVQIDEESIGGLCALGFSRIDCMNALTICNNHLNEAALWLTQHVEPLRMGSKTTDNVNSFEVHAVELRASFISICVIDDCKDADVPLLELSLSQLEVRQELPNVLNNDLKFGFVRSSSFGVAAYKTGCLNGILASDYYNRALSGWEPLIEPWKCDVTWNYTLGTNLQHNSLHLKIISNELLKLNITSTIIELYQLVRDNWTQDYYAVSNNIKSCSSSSNSQLNIRRRNPFIPFCLKNDTGVKLWFIPIISAPGSQSASNELCGQLESQWSVVEPGGVQAFSFGPPNKKRHLDSHKLNSHQIRVRADGWHETGPVSIDKVGIFFRHSRRNADEFLALPKIRIVFAVTLEGSAQKLITVRSSLRVANNIDVTMHLKMEHFFGHMNIRTWPNPITTNLEPGDVYSVPLSHVHSFLLFRPIHVVFAQCDFSGNVKEPWKKLDHSAMKSGSNLSGYLYCEKSLHWKDMDNVGVGGVQQELRTCKNYKEKAFRIVAEMKREGFPRKEGVNMPGHLITLWPPLRLTNLLSCDLLYKIASGTKGRVLSSQTANIHEIDLEGQLEISLTLDSYVGAGHLIVPAGHIGFGDARLCLTDTKSRSLILRAIIYVQKGQGMHITITAPYWLVNRTGLPLVFRQECVQHESAGQFAENEEARLISPLMFSFTDMDVSPALTIRLGKRYGDNPPWCQPFQLHKDILNRQLKSGCSNETFILGIEVRRGRGRYIKTSVVTFSPRFQLYNRSSYKLQFAQKYYATTLTDPLAKSTFIDAVPGCHLPFHWPRLDKEQQLCIRLPDVYNCLWSGGIPIHETQSLYINIRNNNGDMHFLRLEIVLQGATYFLLFGDAQALPPPIRIDNYSEVAIKFYQPDGRHQIRTVVRPHSSLAYVLDEPMGTHSLCIEAPGGVSHTYSLLELGMCHNLTYENFIYIAFSGTFRNDTNGLNRDVSDFDIDCQQLVLGVVDGRVVLVRKQPGDRSQLWRMNNEQQLEHEGSSPPTEPGKRQSSFPRYVLDLEKPPQPMSTTCLVVRPANKQRRSTQTWHFTKEGRLMCEHSNMCIQTRNGFFGLHANGEAVFGRIISDTHRMNILLVPLEQAIEKQKLRPGSGFLSVVISMDGPIRTVQIKDVKSMATSSLSFDPSWRHVSHILPHISMLPVNNQQSRNVAKPFIEELYLSVKLAKGLGISLISNRPNEEICFITLENIAMEINATSTVRSLDLSVGHLQIDNQLFETPCPILMYTSRNDRQDIPERSRLSAIHFNVKHLPSPNTNAVIFEHFLLNLCSMVVYLEERLLLRFAMFMGLAKSMPDPAALPDESDYEAHRVATKILAANATRYYFGDLQIVPRDIRLSVITASKLSAQLSDMKKSLGLTLIKFEDATIDFEKFVDRHHFETLEVYLRAIKNHFKQELKWQAASILGTFDFLGNPVGLANDFSEGVSGLIFEGSVKSLVKNVTHGISNSTAKLTETVSDGLGRVVLDEQDTETRQRILEVPSMMNSSSEHFYAGLKGLGFGILGGVTSIVKHTYTGAQSDGLRGFVSGLGKGIIGTVAKPVIGVLDFTSEAANAMRESSKSSHRILPERKRLPRCLTGAPGGLLPAFSLEQSKGQQHLFLMNKRDFSEQFMAYEPCLFQDKESRLRLLVSTEKVWVFSRTDEMTTTICSYHLSELIQCSSVTMNTTADGHKIRKPQHYIECLTILNKSQMTTSTGMEILKRPRVRCQTEEMAQRASRHINYAISVYNERKHTLNLDSVIER